MILECALVELGSCGMKLGADNLYSLTTRDSAVPEAWVRAAAEIFVLLRPQLNRSAKP